MKKPTSKTTKKATSKATKIKPVPKSDDGLADAVEKRAKAAVEMAEVVAVAEAKARKAEAEARAAETEARVGKEEVLMGWARAAEAEEAAAKARVAEATVRRGLTGMVATAAEAAGRTADAKVAWAEAAEEAEAEAEARAAFAEAGAKARKARVTAANARKERTMGVLAPTSTPTKVNTVGRLPIHPRDSQSRDEVIYEQSVPPMSGDKSVRPSESKKTVTKKADMARLIMNVHGAPFCKVRSTIFKRVEKRVYDAIKRGDITLPCSADTAEKWAKMLTFQVSLNPEEDFLEI